ncbi:MAG: hypothetical protein STSR0008_22810 [Ignavibacterium sp.]
MKAVNHIIVILMNLFFCIELYTGKMYAALMLGGIEIFFYGVKNQDDLPEPLIEWIEAKGSIKVTKG